MAGLTALEMAVCFPPFVGSDSAMLVADLIPLAK